MLLPVDAPIRRAVGTKLANHVKVEGSRGGRIAHKRRSGTRGDACYGNKTPRERGFLRLRGRDSNPNFLIQSQASYH
jgi:hypothetical protein